jgi:hypothetical protein
MGKLLMPGPFLGGLVATGLGVVVFYIIPEMPEAMTPEDTIANAQLLGRIGGGMIGLGVFMMLFGLWRAFRG